MTTINNISPEKYVPVRKQRNGNYKPQTRPEALVACNSAGKILSRKKAA